MNQAEDKKDDFKESSLSQAEQEKLVQKKNTLGNVVEFICVVACIILVAYCVPRHIIQRTIVDGKSMKNTLQDRDNLLVEKVSYHFENPKRFDVIVFYPYGRKQGDYYIKRVIGLPGETVQIKPPYIYINGKRLKEHYGKDPIINAGIAAKPLKLKSNEYFVLGDNRRISEDSRYEEVGPVTKDKIDGKAMIRIYPFSKFGNFDKKYEK